jgi:hypothetical protein
MQLRNFRSKKDATIKKFHVKGKDTTENVTIFSKVDDL